MIRPTKIDKILILGYINHFQLFELNMPDHGILLSRDSTGFTRIPESPTIITQYKILELLFIIIFFTKLE